MGNNPMMAMMMMNMMNMQLALLKGSGVITVPPRIRELNQEIPPRNCLFPFQWDPLKHDEFCEKGCIPD